MWVVRLCSMMSHSSVSSSSRWPESYWENQDSETFGNPQGYAFKNTHVRRFSTVSHYWFHLCECKEKQNKSCKARSMCHGLHTLSASNKWSSLPLKTYTNMTQFTLGKIRLDLLWWAYDRCATSWHWFPTASHFAFFWKTQHILWAWHAAPFMTNDTPKAKLIHT